MELWRLRATSERGRRLPRRNRRGINDHEIYAAVLFHRGSVRILGCFEAPLRERFHAVRSNSDGLKIPLRGVGPAIAEAQVVFRGAPPVTVTFEQQAVPGVRIQIVLSDAEFFPLRGPDVGLVKIEIYCLRLERGAVLPADIKTLRPHRQPGCT